MKDYRDRRVSRRDFCRAAGAAALALAALGCGGYALQRWDQADAAALAGGTGSDHRTPVYLEEMTVEGRTYRQKKNVESYLFLGVLYLVLTLPVAFISKRLERRFQYEA